MNSGGGFDMTVDELLGAGSNVGGGVAGPYGSGSHGMVPQQQQQQQQLEAFTPQSNSSFVHGHGNPSLFMHGNGLNLSTNHGLDLTCPHYEGLNLSVSSHQQGSGFNGSQPQQSQQPPPSQQTLQPHVQASGRLRQPQHQQSLMQVLNLSHNKAPLPSLSTRGSNSQGEVGLNLSIQGINLSRQNIPEGYETAEVEGQYYYTTHQSGGYINLSTQKMPHDNQSSPLNLEHRSSPLNLSSAIMSTSSQAQSQQSQNTQPLSQPTQVDGVDAQYFGIENHCVFPGPTQCASKEGVDDMNTYGLFNQQEPSCQTGFFSENTGYVDNTFDYNGCQNNGDNSEKQRLFCTTCCMEFSSSADLSRHGEREHNEPNVGANDTLDIFQNDVNADKTLSSWQDPAFDNVCGSVLNSIDYDLSSLGAFESNTVTNVDDAGGNADIANGMSTKSATPGKSANTAIFRGDNVKADGSEAVVTCQECSMTFASGLDMKKHLDLAHGGRKTLVKMQCCDCGQEFDDKTAWKAHEAAHAKKRAFMCTHCKATLSSNSALTRHMRCVHDRIQPFSCTECNKKFCENRDLQRHLRVHEKASQVPDCDVCGKSFSNQFLRDKHNCKGPEGKHPCEICDSKLQTEVEWGVHMWRHTKDSKYIIIDVPKELNLPPHRSTLASTRPTPTEPVVSNTNVPDVGRRSFPH